MKIGVPACLPSVRSRISCCAGLRSPTCIFSHLPDVPNRSTQHGRNTEIRHLFCLASSANGAADDRGSVPFRLHGHRQHTDTDNIGLVITVLVLLTFAMFVRLRQ
jgi:hypothetical protein